MDCDKNYSPIVGQTNVDFTAIINGNYAVEILENTCVDTSECVSIATVGINEIEDFRNLLVYPNPSSNSFSVDFEKTLENVMLIITDMQGKTISTTQILNSSKASITLNDPPGFYLLTIKSKEIHTVIKLIKQ